MSDWDDDEFGAFLAGDASRRSYDQEQREADQEELLDAEAEAENADEDQDSEEDERHRHHLRNKDDQELQDNLDRMKIERMPDSYEKDEAKRERKYRQLKKNAEEITATTIDTRNLDKPVDYRIREVEKMNEKQKKKNKEKWHIQDE